MLQGMPIPPMHQGTDQNHLGFPHSSQCRAVTTPLASASQASHSTTSVHCPSFFSQLTTIFHIDTPNSFLSAPTSGPLHMLLLRLQHHMQLADLAQTDP